MACKPIAPMKLQSSHQISKPTNICDCRKMCSRAGLRHVRGVRPNRAADFRGPPFWTLKILYKLTCQFERLWCLDYDANTGINDVEWNWVFCHSLHCWPKSEMLPPDAFCEHRAAGREKREREGRREGKGRRCREERKERGGWAVGTGPPIGWGRPWCAVKSKERRGMSGGCGLVGMQRGEVQRGIYPEEMSYTHSDFWHCSLSVSSN